MNAWHLPQPSANARPRTELGGFSAKAFQLRIAAFSGMECFPLEHFLPGLFVVGVMDLDDVRHVLLFDVLVLPAPALAQHGIPEHLLAGILPEFAGAILGDFRDGRCLPVGRQWEGLIRCGLLICSWHLSVENGSALAEYIYSNLTLQCYHIQRIDHIFVVTQRAFRLGNHHRCLLLVHRTFRRWTSERCSAFVMRCLGLGGCNNRMNYSLGQAFRSRYGISHIADLRKTKVHL